MVRRVLKLWHKEWNGLHQAAFLLALASLASQLLGLLRDRLLAGTFGAGLNLDIYYTAFRIPDLVYVSIASFVSVTVLIPYIAKLRHGEDKQALERFTSSIVTVFSVVMLGVVGVLWLMMPYWSPYLAPGFSTAALAELTLLSRILLLSPFLLGLSNLFGAITQSFHKFLAFTISPILYNLGIIVGIIWLYPVLGLPGLVWGVVIGALLHLMVQWGSVRSLGIFPRPTFHIPWREVYDIILCSLPRTVGLAMHQVSMLVLVAIGSTIVAGGIAVFSLAQNLQTVPMMIIGMSYSVAAFPTLSKLFSDGQREAFVSKIVVAARHIVFWSMPAIVFIVVLRAHIVRVILGSGEFGWTDTRLTAAALALFVISAAGQSLIHLFVRGYYAAGNTAKPLLINIVSAGVIVVSALLLVRWFSVYPPALTFLEGAFRVSDLTGTLILALPLAFSLGTILNSLLFIIAFERDFGGLVASLSKTTLETLMAALMGGVATYAALFIGAPLFELTSVVAVLGQALLAGTIGIGVWLLSLALLKNQEFLELWAVLHAKFIAKEAIVTEQVEL